jgi:hypothetical protein
VSVQRGIEMVGISTVLITVEPAESLQARPPRALCPRGFVAGHSLGRPGDSALQRWIVMDALGLLSSPPAPGTVTTRDYG